MPKKLLILCAWVALSLPAIAQNRYSTGLRFDDGEYEKTPLKARLVTKDYDGAPPKYSLKRYCPAVGNQGSTGTCVAWSSGYAARTITEAIQNHWTDPAQITQNAYSASYLYYYIKDGNDSDCSGGSVVGKAGEAMKQAGIAKEGDLSTVCAPSISAKTIETASMHKIKDYTRLFSIDDASSLKIQTTKKALAEKRPVVIGMKCPDSFFGAKDYWQPTESSQDNHGGHAMCIIGYDDTQHGGAFEVMNSWGAGWGNAGFMWIRYQDYGNFVKYGFEFFPMPKIQPQASETLAGKLDLQLTTQEAMPATLSDPQIGYYKLDKSYKSGNKFRIYVANNAPAYVYVLGADLTSKVNMLFPPKDGISPALSYQNNNIALPGERWHITMDNTVGKDYVCILYSDQPLDIKQIKTQLEQQGSGNIAKRLKTVLGSKIAKGTRYAQKQISFEANVGKGEIVPMIVEIAHQ